MVQWETGQSVLINWLQLWKAWVSTLCYPIIILRHTHTKEDSQTSEDMLNCCCKSRVGLIVIRADESLFYQHPPTTTNTTTTSQPTSFPHYAINLLGQTSSMTHFRLSSCVLSKRVFPNVCVDEIFCSIKCLHIYSWKTRIRKHNNQLYGSEVLPRKTGIKHGMDHGQQLPFKIEIQHHSVGCSSKEIDRQKVKIVWEISRQVTEVKTKTALKQSTPGPWRSMPLDIRAYWA